ncbi:MAG: hypothetical protein GX174_03040 [Lentisphaerae bacterium]|jgi:hypothetical protein|nr:hypothetical protein [Lentisphaerota bacterium]
MGKILKGHYTCTVEDGKAIITGYGGMIYAGRPTAVRQREAPELTGA